MNCREFRQNLSLYVDDALAPQLRAVTDEHLRECPLCREKLAELLKLIDALRQIEKPVISFDLQSAVKNRIRTELAAQAEINRPVETKSLGWRRIWEKYLQPQLVPYASGALASFLLFAMMFASLIHTIATFHKMELQAKRERQEREMLLASLPNKSYDELPTIPAADYAVRRLDVATESPSLNPNSAFVSLTSSLTRNESQDEAIMVVADVLSDGIAQISYVIQPPRQPEKLAELEKLLHDDPAFVSAALDRRPENVRVVLLIQKVEVPLIQKLDVYVNEEQPKRSKSKKF